MLGPRQQKRGIQAELRVPIRESSDDEREERRKRRKKKGACCGNDCSAATPMQACTMLSVTGIFLLMVVLVASVYGPYGRVNQMLATTETMIAQVNSSGITNVVFDMGQSWLASNMTASTLHLMADVFASADVISGLIFSIEPELVRELANRTSISVTAFLNMVDNIVVNKGLNIQIPLGR
jgi:hypothetical protein